MKLRLLVVVTWATWAVSAVVATWAIDAVGFYGTTVAASQKPSVAVQTPPAPAPTPPTGVPGQPATPDSHEQMNWWFSDKFKQALGLAPEQSTRIEEIFQATMPKLRRCKEDLDKREAVLSVLISGGSTEAMVTQQIDRVEAARSELGKARTLMLYRMHRVLSQEQRSKLKAMHDQRERERKSASHPRS